MSCALRETVEEHFNGLDDPRRRTTNQRHEFIDILMITLCGVICGANHWTAVATFGRAKEAWLKGFLALPNGIPSHDTFNNVFAKLDPQQFEASFISWSSSIASLLPGEVISVDGKTLRRSYDTANASAAIHRVSAWSTSNELVLGQYKTHEKSNEITAIPLLLELLSLKGSLVTIDAMGCQKQIAQTILGQGADYLLAVKDNQPSLYEAINELFFESDDEAFDDYFTDYVEQANKGHGREEKRRCWVCDELGEWSPLVAMWPGLKAFVVIESQRSVGDNTTTTY